MSKEAPASTKPRPLRLSHIPPISGWLALTMALVCGYFMRQLPLWGWLTFAFFVGVWWANTAFFAHLKQSDRVRHQAWWLSTATGLLLGLGFPVSPLTPLLFIAFVPLLLAGDEYKKAGRGAAKYYWLSWHGLVWWNILSTWWVSNSAFFAGIVAILVNSLLMAIPFLAFYKGLRHSRWLAVTLFASTWLSYEWVHHRWEMTWPWLALGNGLSQWPIAIQWYEWTGAPGGSVWILVANAVLYLGFKGSQLALFLAEWLNFPRDKSAPRPESGHLSSQYEARRSLGEVKMNEAEVPSDSKLVGRAISLMLQFGIVLILPFLVSLYLWFSYQPSGMPKEVVAIQPNYEPHYRKFEVPEREQLDRIKQLAMDAVTVSTDWLVLPETSFGDNTEEHGIATAPGVDTLRQVMSAHPKLRVLVGTDSYKIYRPGEPLDGDAIRIAKRPGGDKYWEAYNTALFLDPDSVQPGIYHKSRLVPGAEQMPYKKIFGFATALVDNLGGTLEGVGTQPEAESFGGDATGRAAPIICYESIFGDYVRQYVGKADAEALFVISNDGWWDKTPGFLQHRQFAVMRAIENRLDVVRATNSGSSCFINQRGQITQATDYDVPTAIKGQMLFRRGDKTLYARYGDWVSYLGLGCLLIGFLFLMSTYTRKTH
jgi:apolipoprotein N-acyltransferase